MDFRKKKDTKRSLFSDRMFWTKWHSHIFLSDRKFGHYHRKALGTVSISALTKDHAYCGVMGMKNTEMYIDIERY